VCVCVCVCVVHRQSVFPMRSAADDRRKAESVNRCLATLSDVITSLGRS